MTPDVHTACPACPAHVRALYAVGRRVLAMLESRDGAQVEQEELAQALDALRPFIEAHHANQLHAFSNELERARTPEVPA